MSTINDPEVQELLANPNYAVVSTLNADGSIESTLAWVAPDNGGIAVNSAIGRHWPTNLERDPHVTVLVQEAGNPYNFVEIRGTASGTTDGADEHIDALAKKYLGVDEYPMRTPDERRIKYQISPTRVRHMKMG